MTQDTGLIGRPLLPEARAIVFKSESEERVRETVRLIAAIDQAHTVMLVESKIVARPLGQAALRAVQALIGSGFDDVISREPVRGIYMLYESVLAEMAPGAADLHVARSRNDINATLFTLRCRRSVADLISEILRLVRSIEASIGRDGVVNMPVFSHRRPGMPGTWELYMSTIATAVLRDASDLVEVLRYLDVCPLGAGAGAGSEIEIDTARTATLLGFGFSPSNSLEAVACRDAGLRAIATAAILGSNLSRLAADLVVWYAEQNAISLPDELVGASSIMPQKRNAFLLEHILGMTGRLTGALSASLAACHGSPFANAIQVGTESVAAIFDGLSIAKDVTTLSALMIDGARPIADRFEAISRQGAVGATALALQMRHHHEISFREAHRRVGEALRTIRSDDPVREAASTLGLEARMDQHMAMKFGGGPGSAELRRNKIEQSIGACESQLSAYLARWRDAERSLETAVNRIVALEEEFRR